MNFIYKKKYGLYRPLPISCKPWESVSMNLMTQLLECNGMHAIFMVVDQFSKLAKMAPTRMFITTFDSVKLTFDMWVKHHRMPKFIVSDRDAKFTMSF
jgi:hypothetical protein